MEIFRKMKSVWKAHLALFIVNLLYAASHILAKGVMPLYLTPTVFILLRVSGACLLFWVLYRFFYFEKILKKDIGLLAACGLFGVAINQLFFFHGLHLSSAFNAGIIMAFNPIMVVILSYFLRKEKISLLQAIGIFLGTSGTIALTMNSAGTSSGSIFGDVFLVLNSLSYAIYLVIAKPLMSKYKPLTVITWVFTFGLGFVLIFPPTIPETLATNFMQIPVEFIWKIVYVIVGVTFFTYLLTMYGLRYLSPTASSTYIYAQPVMVIFFTILFASIGWSENYTSAITGIKIMLMLIIFIGVYFANFKNK